MLEQSILLVLKLLLNTRIIWMVFIKKLKIIIQIKNDKVLIVFDDVIADMLSICQKTLD